MTLPRQSFGLNKFSTSISSCPYNADSVKAIVIQRNNLAVVNGASTEMELVLSNFYSTINTASKISLTLNGSGSTAEPYSLYKISSEGENVKFIAILPTFGTGSTVSNVNEYIEWVPMSSIDSGILYDEPVYGPSASAGILFDIDKINALQFGWGKNLSFTGGTGPLWLGTDGGLIKWNGTDMRLWNALNSSLPSDFVTSMDVDTSNSLWLGTSKGICYFNETSGFSRLYNADNSSLLSDQVNDIKLLSTDRVVIATDLGMSILNFSTNSWESFDIYSVPTLLYNKINRLAVNGLKVFLGTTGGLFEYDASTLTWSNPFNSSTSGWSAPDDVKCLATYGNNLFVGTTGGLVVLSFVSGTAHTIVAGSTGPVSSNISSLRYVKYGLQNLLYAGHDDGISVMDIDTETWGFTANSSSYSELVNVSDLLPDFLSGSTGGKTVWFGNSSGLNKMFTVGPTFGSVPESNKSTNLLMMYPGNNLTLYPSLQPIYFIFSKPMNTASFESHFLMKDKLTTSTCNTHGATVTGTWEWSYNNQVAKYTTELLLKATPYELTISKGSTAADSSHLKEFPRIEYYTENVSPEFGWLPLGKLMILTGTNDHYLPGLYLRNPQSFDVKLDILVGII